MREEIIIMSALIVLSGFIALELGLLAGMLAHEFLPFEDIEIIEVLANLGILTLMYVAGLEIDLDQLERRFKPSFVIGTTLSKLYSRVIQLSIESRDYSGSFRLQLRIFRFGYIFCNMLCRAKLKVY